MKTFEEKFDILWASKFGMSAIKKGELGYPDYLLFKQFFRQEIKAVIEEIGEMEENYEGGLERFEEQEGADLHSLIEAYNLALSDTQSLLRKRFGVGVKLKI